MPLLFDLLGLGADAIGTAAGELWAAPEDERARQLEQDALEAMLNGQNLPELQDINPERLSSNFEGIAADPQSVAAQRAALNDMMRMGRDNGGMEARAAQQRAELQAQQASRAEQQAALSQLQSRGMGGSGQALAARLQSGSNAANAQAMAGTQGAMDARRQALMAMQSGAGIAGQMRGQSFGEQAQRAGGMDAISRFNAQNAMSAQMANNANRQQGFQNQMGLTSAQNDARYRAAGGARDDANRRRGIAQGAGAVGRNVAGAGGDAIDEGMDFFMRMGGGR